MVKQVALFPYRSNLCLCGVSSQVLFMFIWILSGVLWFPPISGKNMAVCGLAKNKLFIVVKEHVNINLHRLGVPSKVISQPSVLGIADQDK